jgi:hypothetical protein
MTGLARQPVCIRRSSLRRTDWSRKDVSVCNPASGVRLDGKTVFRTLSVSKSRGFTLPDALVFIDDVDE